MKIKDVELLKEITGNEKLPVSNGSDTPATVTINQILNKASGVPIVDSEDKLDPNAPQGSLASVAYDAIEATSFRDMYLPTMDIMDLTNGALTTPELLTSVQRLEWTFPENIQLTEEEAMFYLVPRSISMDNPKVIMVCMAYDGISIITVFGDFANTETITIAVFSNGKTTIYQDAIDICNNEILTTDDWCYFSNPDTGCVITEEQFDFIDMFVKGASGIQVTDLYIKESENFVQLCKKSETEKLISKIDEISEHLQEEIDEVAERIGIPVTQYSVGANSTIYLDPNTYIKHNQTGNLSINFTEPTNNEIVNEYILELVCDGSSVTFPEGIRWKGNEIPVFLEGTTVIITVINNLAIAATFESK